MIRKLSTTVIVFLSVMSFIPIFANYLHLDLIMPGSMFAPGTPFYLDLTIEDTGSSFSEVQLYVALTVGTGDFWFYPSWDMYPPNIDWDYVNLSGTSWLHRRLIPEFSWPEGAGAFYGAVFYAAVVHNENLVSNLADYTFGWFEDHQPPLMVSIPPGTYIRGSPEDEPCRTFVDLEEIEHEVTLTREFYMMTTEVTRQMWVDLKAAQPTLPDDPSDTARSPTMDHPVQNIAWYEAVLFANLMSLRDGYTPCYYADKNFTTPVDATNYGGWIFCDFDANGYRLPTEAEWEYACRAGTTGPFSAHEPNYNYESCRTAHPNPPLTVLNSIAWWKGNSGETAHPVGTKLANPWGLYDMHGNVAEWVWDHENQYTSEPVTDPRTGGVTSMAHMMIRGGTCLSNPGRVRSASRTRSRAFVRGSTRGFRLVRTGFESIPSPTPTPTPTLTPTSTSTPTPTPSTPTATPVPMEFVYIPHGNFLRGSPEDEPCRLGTESPQHLVILTRGFYMMKTEVTRQMWADLKSAQPTLPDDPSDTAFSSTMNHPVQCVSWFEAVLFANLMSLRDGFTRCYYKDPEFSIPVDVTNYTSGRFYCDFDALGYRLPTEAEWEYACRAGTTGPFSAYEPNFSTDICWHCSPSPPLTVLDSIAWWCGNSGDTAHPVGTKLPNPWGLHDMHGNVSEWCWDGSGNYSSEPVTDPTEPGADPTFRIARGGSFVSWSKECRSAFRFDHVRPANGYATRGFRLVRTADKTQPTPTPSTPTATPTPTLTSTPTPTPTPTPSTPTATPVPMEFVYISSGTYTRGSPPDEPGRVYWESPQHQVTFTRDFYIMTTTVTRQMWADLKTVQPTLPDDPTYPLYSPSINHPVSGLQWFEAVLFANLLSIQDGLTPCYYVDETCTTIIDATNYYTYNMYCDFDADGYRLPTEAEWEYAARAGATGPFFEHEPNYSAETAYTCSPDPPLHVLNSIAWWCGNAGETRHPVGTKLSNPWGLYDVHGNTWEWCWDWYGSYPSEAVIDPTGPETGESRVFRGGSFISLPRFCRVAHRVHLAPNWSVAGFRLVRTVP